MNSYETEEITEIAAKGSTFDFFRYTDSCFLLFMFITVIFQYLSFTGQTTENRQLTDNYGGPGGHAMRRYLSADGDVTVDDDDVTVDVGDVKIDTRRLPSAKPIVCGPGYHAHTHSCGHVCAEKIQKIEKPTW